VMLLGGIDEQDFRHFATFLPVARQSASRC
jgi:hypothetical protein